MARKTNYKFEKLDRERRKAEKKAAKAEAKQAASDDGTEPVAPGASEQPANGDVEGS